MLVGRAVAVTALLSILFLQTITFAGPKPVEAQSEWTGTIETQIHYSWSEFDGTRTVDITRSAQLSFSVPKDPYSFGDVTGTGSGHEQYNLHYIVSDGSGACPESYDQGSTDVTFELRGFVDEETGKVVLEMRQLKPYSYIVNRGCVGPYDSTGYYVYAFDSWNSGSFEIDLRDGAIYNQEVGSGRQGFDRLTIHGGGSTPDEEFDYEVSVQPEVVEIGQGEPVEFDLVATLFAGEPEPVFVEFYLLNDQGQYSHLEAWDATVTPSETIPYEFPTTCDDLPPGIYDIEVRYGTANDQEPRTTSFTISVRNNPDCGPVTECPTLTITPTLPPASDPRKAFKPSDMASFRLQVVWTGKTPADVFLEVEGGSESVKPTFQFNPAKMQSSPISVLLDVTTTHAEAGEYPLAVQAAVFDFEAEEACQVTAATAEVVVVVTEGFLPFVVKVDNTQGHVVIVQDDAETPAREDQEIRPGTGIETGEDGNVEISSDDGDFGHGTFAAGIIAADDDGNGMVGVAPDSQLYALKVLDGSGLGYISDIVAALQWCVDNQVHIASMSFGLSSDSPALRDAIADAHNNGIVLIAAAGNTGRSIQYPAAYDQVIAVGATDRNDMRAGFSATGPDLELVAPGVDVVSTYPLSMAPYGYDSGTSASAPHVAGVAAIVKSTEEMHASSTNRDGIWTSSEIKTVLASTALDLGVDGRDSSYGFGLVQANSAATKTAAGITVSTRTAEGPIHGYYTVISQHGAVLATGFSPFRFAANYGETYEVAVADYGEYVFDHWQGSTYASRQTIATVAGETEITAIYRNVNDLPILSSASEPSVTVRSIDYSSGNAINGYYTTLIQNGQIISSGFTPVTFSLQPGKEFTVSVQDYGQYFFHHWSDGKTGRERSVRADSAVTFTAVYTADHLPPAPSGPSISVTTVKENGDPLPGYYVTLWAEGSMVEWAYSPATFTVKNNTEYQIAVADYGSYFFDRWNDGSSERFYRISTGERNAASLTATYAQ